MKRNTQFTALTVAFLACPNLVHADNLGNEAKLPAFIVFLVSLIGIIITIVFLIRFWRATEDINALKAKICNKGLAEKSIMRSEVMKLHLLDKDTEALEILNDALYDEARRLFRSINESQDYKGMVYQTIDKTSKKLTCEEAFDYRWKAIQEKYDPLYKSINQKIPTGLQYVTFSYIQQFGKPSNKNSN